MERNVRRRSKVGFGRVTIGSGRDRYDIRCEIYQASVEEITITVFSQERERGEGMNGRMNEWIKEKKTKGNNEWENERNKRGEESLNDSLALISILISREFLFSSPIGTKKKFSREIPREIWNRGNRSNCLSVTSPRSRQTSTLSHLTGLLYFNLRDVLRAQFFFSSLFLSFVFPFLG